jgi:metal-responsive CopG/Arc/MetJ family transcriptional regulator
MRVHVSIPDDLFRTMEAVARRNGKSRSELYTEALRLFLMTRRAEAVTAQLNRVYRRQDSRLDPLLSQLQTTALQEHW